MALQFFLQDRSPFTETFEISSNADAPVISVQLLSATTTPVSFGGSTATVVMSMDSELGVQKVTAAAGAVVTLSTGIFSYSFTAANLNTPGRYFAQFLVTDALTGKKYAIPNNGKQRLMVTINSSV